MAEIKSGFFKMDKLDVLLPKFSVSGNLELTGPLRQLNMSQVSMISCHFIFNIKN